MNPEDLHFWTPEEIHEVASTLADALYQYWTSESVTIYNNMFISSFEFKIQQTPPEELVIDLEALSSELAGIYDPIGQIAKFITQVFNSIASWIVGTLSSAVKGFIDWLWSNIESAFRTVYDWFESITKTITEGFTKLAEEFRKVVIEPINRAVSAALDFLSRLPEYVSNFVESIRSGLEELWKLITSVGRAVQDAFSTVMKFFDEVRKGVADLVRWITDVVRSAIETLSKGAQWLADQFRTLFTQVYDAVRRFIEFLTRLPEVAPDIIRNVASWVWEQLIKPVYDFIVDNIIEPLRKGIEVITENVRKGFEAIAKTFTGYVNAVLRLPELLGNVFKPVIDWFVGTYKFFTETLPKFFEDVRKFFEDLTRSLSTIANAVSEFFRDPAKWFSEYVVKPITTALQTFALEAVTFFQDIGDRVVSFFSDISSWVWEKLTNLAKSFIETLKNMVRGAVEFVQDLLQWFYETFVKEPFQRLTEAVKEAVRKAMSPQQQGGEVDIAFRVFSMIFFNAWGAVAPYVIMGGLGDAVGDLEVALEPVGIGGKWTFRPLKVVVELAKAGRDLAMNYFTGFFIGLAMNMLDPYKWIVRPMAKEFFDDIFRERYGIEAFFEMPTITQLRDIVRRAMTEVTDFRKLPKLELPEKLKAIYETSTKLLELRGYPKFFIEYFMDLGKQYSMEITDRFGTKRFLPFSPLFEIPTHSEVVRMLQRDVFANPMEWARFVRIYGMSDDLAKMYYMMAFRYPSFEKLWEFVMRGVTGMLWYTPPQFAVELFKADAAWLGAGEPIPPAKLNFNYKALFTAVNFYLKWLEYSNFSWFRKGAKIRYGEKEVTFDFDWTADSWMLWDIAADIPTKIDARWMTKWGLFDHLSRKANVKVPGVGETVQPYPEKAFLELAASVVENTVASPVVMDLRPLCRILIARGLHPGWVPITAVAEAINALTDERTLLRTGFINLFKEGFWTIETLEKLLAGFVTASFVVEYFDVEKMKWVGGAVNVPVAYLPAERKLLELRAAMDRALDILRDLVRELNRSYAENIIQTYDDYLRDLEEGIGAVNEWFKPLVKDITGKELELVADESYYKAYKRVLDVYRELYTIHRLRYWVGRFIGWVIYRLAYGYVTPEDVNRIVSILAEYGRLTDIERELLTTITDVMVGIARREYIPTPAQLATIAEVIPEARKLFYDVVTKRRIPPEWVPIWKKYIDVRPLMDEVRRVASRIEDLYSYFIVDEKTLHSFYEKLRPFGYEDHEIELMVQAANLEAIRRAWSELVGTPKGLVTMAEYSPRARRLVLAQVKKMIEKLPVDPATKQFLYAMWEEYVRVRPVYDEVRRYITELLSDYANGIITRDELVKELEDLKKWGLDDYEVQFYLELAEKRRKRYLARRMGCY